MRKNYVRLRQRDLLTHYWNGQSVTAEPGIDRDLSNYAHSVFRASLPMTDGAGPMRHN
jgi:hypothetical protein